MARNVSQTAFVLLCLFGAIGAGAVWYGAHVATEGAIPWPFVFGDLNSQDMDDDGTPDIRDNDIDGDGVLNENDLDPYDPEVGGDTPPPSDTKCPVTFTVTKKGDTSTKPGLTCYAWYDWNGDGQIQRSLYTGYDEETNTLSGGEISLPSVSSGVVTTSTFFPSEEWVYFQLICSGYEPVTYVRQVPTPASSWGGTTAIPVANMEMIALDGSITVTVSEADAGVLVTSSGDYNYTTYGADATLTFRINCATSDAGIGVTADYTNWDSGYSYVRSFVGIIMDSSDAANCVFQTAYDGYDQVGSYVYVWWWLDSFTDGTIFNDAGVTGDGAASMSISISIVGDFDFNYINIYDEVKLENFNQRAWGTADGSETDIDFVA